MSAKGIYSVYLYNMSQYKDSITGRVIYDIRFYDDFGYTFGEKLRYRSFQRVNNTNQPTYNLINETTKFSSKCLCLQNAACAFYTINSLDSAFLNTSLYTLSFWVYIVRYDTTSAPGCIEFDFAAASPTPIIMHRLVSEHTRKIYYEKNGYGGFALSNTLLSTGTWHHVAFVRNGTSYKAFADGNRIIDTSTTNYPVNLKSLYINNFSYNSSIIPRMYLDDIVVIGNQALWSSNFTVPNNYLTGDHDLPTSKRLASKNIIKLNSMVYSNYFDKAYLY